MRVARLATILRRDLLRRPCKNGNDERERRQTLPRHLPTRKRRRTHLATLIVAAGLPLGAIAQEPALPPAPAPAPAARSVCVDAGATDQRTLDRIAAELDRIDGVRVDCTEHDVRFYLFVERLTDAEGAVLGWYGALTYRTADMPPMALNLQTYTGPDYDDVFLPAFLRVAVAAILPRLR